MNSLIKHCLLEMWYEYCNKCHFRKVFESLQEQEELEPIIVDVQWVEICFEGAILQFLQCFHEISRHNCHTIVL